MTVQPTEQCVHTVLRRVTSAPALGGGPALAGRTLPISSVPSMARPPAVRPDRRRNVRRSSPAGLPAMAVERDVLRAGVSAFLTSTFGLRSVAIDAVERLDVLGFPVAR